MKKLLSVFAFLLISSVAMAQVAGDFRINAGLAYGSEASLDGGGLGINAGVEYFFTDVISGAPSYTYFFEDSEEFFGSEISVRLSSINLDGRYYFMTDDIQVYGMAGIAILAVNFESVDPFSGTTFEDSDSETGLNIGGGVVIPLSGNLGFNGQLKYQTPGDGQLVINAGVAIGIN